MKHAARVQQKSNDVARIVERQSEGTLANLSAGTRRLEASNGSAGGAYESVRSEARVAIGSAHHASVVDAERISASTRRGAVTQTRAKSCGDLYARPTVTFTEFEAPGASQNHPGNGMNLQRCIPGFLIDFFSILKVRFLVCEISQSRLWLRQPSSLTADS